MSRTRRARAFVRAAAAASFRDDAPVTLDGATESLREVERYLETYGAGTGLVDAYRAEVAAGASFSRAWMLRAWFPGGVEAPWPGVLEMFPELADAARADRASAIVDEDELRADADGVENTIEVTLLFDSADAAYRRLSPSAFAMVASGAATVALIDVDRPEGLRYLRDGVEDETFVSLFVADAGVRLRAAVSGHEVASAFGFVADAGLLEIAGLGLDWPHEAEEEEDDDESMSIVWANLCESLASRAGVALTGDGEASLDSLLDAVELAAMSKTRREALATLLAAALRLRLEDCDLDPGDAARIAHERVFGGRRLASALAGG